ncbi:MAG: hypothetical protein NTZ16_04945, partial [Verrucomicrobia bacterium]|nr:hypothetical protein [Verrucomicrobiota bacterium]
VVNNPGLINFNLDYVTPAANGQLRYTAGDHGPYSGNCTLKCHGQDHVETSYPDPAPVLLRMRQK